MNEKKIAIKINGLSKSFGYLTVLNELNIEVQGGQFISIFGPNGAGKTTLLKILATLMKPSSGKVIIAGFDLFKDSNEIRRKIGFLSHEKFLYDNLTACENLKFFSKLYGTKDANSTSIKLLEKVGIIEKKDEITRNLSSGMKQRVSIARALVLNPQIVLLDEPFTGLDAKGVELLKLILYDLKSSGKTVLMSTHNFQSGIELGDRFIVINKGEIKLDDMCNKINIDDFYQTYNQIIS